MTGLQEAEVNTNSYEKGGEFHWYFSSNVLDEDRDEADELGQNNKRISATLWNKISEKRGVAL
eukprot:8607075-Karenia_brevis.AAC.1